VAASFPCPLRLSAVVLSAVLQLLFSCPVLPPSLLPSAPLLCCAFRELSDTLSCAALLLRTHIVPACAPAVHLLIRLRPSFLVSRLQMAESKRPLKSALKPSSGTAAPAPAGATDRKAAATGAAAATATATDTALPTGVTAERLAALKAKASALQQLRAITVRAQSLLIDPTGASAASAPSAKGKGAGAVDAKSAGAVAGGGAAGGRVVGDGSAAVAMAARDLPGFLVRMVRILCKPLPPCAFGEN
jgi:hypothetical protein